MTKTEIMDYVEKLENRIAQNERNIEYLKGRVEAALTLANEILDGTKCNTDWQRRLKRIEEDPAITSGSLQYILNALDEWREHFS